MDDGAHKLVHGPLVERIDHGGLQRSAVRPDLTGDRVELRRRAASEEYGGAFAKKALATAPLIGPPP